MPMRTPFTPALPTGILLCELAITVSGSSTRTRSGEFNLLSLGVTDWVELISIRILSVPGTTFTRCNWLRCAEAWTGLAAESGFAVGAGWEDGIAAGFTAGAGAPGAGLAFAGTPVAFRAAWLSLACFCCSDFAALR